MTTTLDWSWDQMAFRRLTNNHLLRQLPSRGAVQAVRDVCGLQAQVAAAAELGVAVRTDSLTRTELQHLIDVNRGLTRTYAMRGTAYLLPTDDLPLYMAGMRYIYGGDAWFTRFGLDRQQADDLFGATANILDGKTLDRQELITALEQEAAKAFYVEKLGFAVLRDDTFGDQRWIQLTPASAQTSITLVTAGMPPGSQRGVILATKDIRADHKTLKARGVDISEIQEMPWGKFATFADPDGNGWVLQQFAG